MKTHRAGPAVSIVTGLGLLAFGRLPAIQAQETAPACCGRTIVASGDFKHFKTPAGVRITGATDPAAFAEEVYGKQFTVTVTGLEAGQYTIEVELAEVFNHAAGQRVMDISAEGQKLFENLDIFQAAGGFGKAYRVRGTVQHQGDALRGPLTITFTAHQDAAKFNAIRIMNAQGEVVAAIKAQDLVDLTVAGASKIPEIKDPPIYANPDQPAAKRAADLVRRMSLKEKVGQMMDAAPAIERLGVPVYNYWNECLHGVARAGTATVFPQAIGLGATWDSSLIHNVADAISTEARAKHHEAVRRGNRDRYYGLTFWTPNINIFRDPRWGRGQETYGEDPFLTARIGVAFIEGLQGNDPHYIKAMACAKHFAVHSGPESQRHRFNVTPSPRDLHETYLPQFEAAVREAKVGQVMSAYNALNGIPAPANSWLLTDLLRRQWGFDGYVVSDCDAVADVSNSHHYAPDAEHGAALSLLAGNDLNCGNAYGALVKAVNQGLVTEAAIDTAVQRLFVARFRLGLFDPPERVPYASIPITENDSPAHHALALQTAHESIVLLKNTSVLPLDKTRLKRLAVIGANADSVDMLLGNYNGTPSHPITILQGLKNALGPGVEVVAARGCPLALKPGQAFGADNPDFKQAVAAAQGADAVVYVGGISPQLEGEEMSVSYDGFSGGDRTRIELPDVQTALLTALHATGKPVIFVNCSGSAIAMPWAAANLPAIIQAWYPGQEGGTAVADVLFGNYNPCGRLPVTFYRSTQDLPAFEDYSMANRTYRYFHGQPLFAFGHGLSYSTFQYGKLKLSANKVAASGTFTVSVAVTNTGPRDGDEVVQCYVHAANASVPMPLRQLKAFAHVSIAHGQTKTVTMQLATKDLSYWDEKKQVMTVETGRWDILVGASSSDIRQTGAVMVH